MKSAVLTAGLALIVAAPLAGHWLADQVVSIMLALVTN